MSYNNVHSCRPTTKAQDAGAKAVSKPASAAMDRDQVKDAVYKAKLEIGLKATPPVKVPKAAAAAAAAAAAPANPVRQNFRDDESTKGAQSIRNTITQPTATAWQGCGVAHPPVVHISSPAQEAPANSFQSVLLSSPSQTDRSLQRQHLQQLDRTPTKQSDKQAAGVRKGEPVHAAASPITPNAIKAFQPEQAECDTPLSAAADSQEFAVEDCLESNADGESIWSDDEDVGSDALFAMDHSSTSDLDKHATAFSSDVPIGHSSTGQESCAASGPKTAFSSEADGLSAVSPHGSHSNSAVEASEQLHQQFLQAVAWQKALGYAAEYQKLGYSQVQSIAAVNKWGDDMQGALTWLVQTKHNVLQVPCLCLMLRIINGKGIYHRSACHMNDV